VSPRFFYHASGKIETLSKALALNLTIFDIRSANSLLQPSHEDKESGYYGAGFFRKNTGY